jgi:DNA replication protein DnaC
VAQAVQAARNWQALRRRQINRERTSPGVRPFASLILAAPNYGCGKTHIALAAFWSVALYDCGVPVAPAGRSFMASALIQSLEGDTSAASQIGRRWSDLDGTQYGTPLVLIDDVGTEGTLEYVAERRQEAEMHTRYFKVIDYCYQNGIGVLMTSNLPLVGNGRTLEAHVGGRAWSRLMEMAPAGLMVDMSGVPDYRKKSGGR